MRRFSLLVLVPLLLAGCTERVVPPGGSANRLPFDLTLPSNLPASPYLAISGLITSVRSVQVIDSVVEQEIFGIYAQFAVGQAPVPSRILVSGYTLERLGTSDTFRLGEADPAELSGDVTWSIADSTDSLRTFTIGRIEPIDSVLPFNPRITNQSFRSDTSLKVTWQPPTGITGGMYFEWQGPNHTWRQNASDNLGYYTIPADVMTKLRGRGTLVMTRYLYLPRKLNGRDMVVARLAQRRYNVTVQ